MTQYQIHGYSVEIRNARTEGRPHDVTGGEHVVTLSAPNGDGLQFAAATEKEAKYEAAKYINWHLTN